METTELEFTIIETADLPDTFVAIAVSEIGSDPKHSGLVVRHNNNFFLYHYPGKNELEEETDLNILKSYKLGIVNLPEFSDFSLVEAMVGRLKLIQSEGAPTYGFLFEPALFDTNGIWSSSSELPEIYSCVGFCIAALESIKKTEEPYLELVSWQKLADTIPECLENYANSQIAKLGGNEILDQYNRLKTRITPIELLTSPFCLPLSINKTEIDGKMKEAKDLWDRN